MKAGLLIALSLAASASAQDAAPRVAHRIVRFLDDDGVERYGEEALLPDGGGGGDAAARATAELIEGDAFGARHLTGRVATIARRLSPVPKPPAIYAIGLNYVEHALEVQIS